MKAPLQNYLFQRRNSLLRRIEHAQKSTNHWEKRCTEMRQWYAGRLSILEIELQEAEFMLETYLDTDEETVHAA